MSVKNEEETPKVKPSSILIVPDKNGDAFDRIGWRPAQGLFESERVEEGVFTCAPLGGKVRLTLEGMDLELDNRAEELFKTLHGLLVGRLIAGKIEVDHD